MTHKRINGVTRVDIGCGFPEQKWEGCFGIDVNPDCRPDLAHDADEGLPFDDETLEFINMDNSLEHYKHPYFVLQ